MQPQVSTIRDASGASRRDFCRLAAGVAALGPFAPTVFAQEAAGDVGPRIGPPKMCEVKIGMVVTAQSGPCQGLVGSAPVPLEWPEQKVKIIKEDITPGVRADYRNVSGTVRQLIVSVPFLGAGLEARAIITYEVQRSPIQAPTDPSVFRIPAKPSNDVRPYLGPSPGIETAHVKIREGAKEAVAGKATAWEKVESIYEWTREKVKYENGPFRGAWTALKEGKGDCEELSSLFIALCRISGVPARTVWVPDHCYPEFYLEDSTGKGHWIPCQAAGTRDFGGIPELRPILQKGDNFRVPDRSGMQRYVAEHLTGKGGKPTVRFVREMVDPSL